MKLLVIVACALYVVGVAKEGGAQGVPWVLSPGSYCQARLAYPGQEKCCDGRQDDCSRPYLDSLCYCDQFCDRPRNPDCCPDYKRVCLGEAEQPPPQEVVKCFHEGRYYAEGAHALDNCNKCTCHAAGAKMECERKACLVRPEVIAGINAGNYGWRAANYSFFWGKSLEEGYKLWAGICKPDHPVLSQTSIQNSVESQVDGPLDDHFDARHKWPRLIRPVSDQMAYPASWAISTVDVASDRLAIQSNGEQKIALSAQNLISCIHPRKHACATSTDRAWWYLSVFGVVDEQCYPYRSGYNSEKHHCQASRDTWSEHSKCAPEANAGQGDVYRSPPAYRVSSKEEDIMTEIRSNGPVQALLHVHNDFFYYREGIYRHTRLYNDEQLPLNNHVHRYLAVRIIGWGVEREGGRGAKYWLCVNSWGSGWGEGGYFKIVRGEDESGIEMFVVGVWARKHKNGNREYSNYIED